METGCRGIVSDFSEITENGRRKTKHTKGIQGDPEERSLSPIHPTPMTRIFLTRFAKGWRVVCFPWRMTFLISEFFKMKNGHEIPSQSPDFDENFGKSYCGTRRVHLRPPRGPVRQKQIKTRPGNLLGRFSVQFVSPRGPGWP